MPLPSEPIVLAEVVDLALRTGRRIVDPVTAEAGCLERGVSHDEWFAAAISLESLGLVALQTAPPSQVVLLAATNPGILRHLQATGFDLERAKERLARAVCAAEPNQPFPLAEAVDQPALLVECLLEGWVDERLLVFSKAPGRRFRIHRVDFDRRSTGWRDSP